MWYTTAPLGVYLSLTWPRNPEVYLVRSYVNAVQTCNSCNIPGVLVQEYNVGTVRQLTMTNLLQMGEVTVSSFYFSDVSFRSYWEVHYLRSDWGYIRSFYFAHVMGSTVAKWLRHLAPKREFAGSSLRWVPKIAGWSGRFINVRHFGGLSMVPLQLTDPLELYVKRGDFFPGSGFLSRHDMT